MCACVCAYGAWNWNKIDTSCSYLVHCVYSIWILITGTFYSPFFVCAGINNAYSFIEIVNLHLVTMVYTVSGPHTTHTIVISSKKQCHTHQNRADSRVQNSVRANIQRTSYQNIALALLLLLYFFIGHYFEAFFYLCDNNNYHGKKDFRKLLKWTNPLFSSSPPNLFLASQLSSRWLSTVLYYAYSSRL